MSSIRNGTRSGIILASPSRFDANALAYIGAIGDLPYNYQTVINSLVVDLKTYGLWTKLKFGLLPAITLDDTATVIDIKTAVKLSGAALKGTTDTGNRNVMACPVPTGFQMLNASSDYIKTGAIPSTLHTLNDTCIAHGVMEITAGANTYHYSAFQAAGADLQAVLRSAGNSAIVDNYANTSNAGRNTFASVTDDSGDWLINRRSATDLEVYRNGVSVGTAANGGGALPNVEIMLGCQNNAGTPANYRNHVCSYHLQFSGLTATQRNNLITVINTYKTNLGNLGSLTRNLIWDGNSLSKYENQNSPRATLYYAYSNYQRLYRFRNYAVPGNTTAQRLAAYAAGPATQYSASYTKNIYVIWEIRNEIYGGATTATAKSNLDALVAAAQATGFIVVVMPPDLTDYTGNTGRTETQFNLAIDEMYTYCQANSFGADYVIAYTDTDMWVPRSDYASDAAYNTAIASKILGPKYVDGTHRTPTGYRSIGSMVSSQALALIG